MKMKKSILLLMVLCLTIVLQAQTSKIITNLTAGDLKSKMTSIELSTVTSLTVSGTMDARDFYTINVEMPRLSEIDLRNVTITEYTGIIGTGTRPVLTYPANTIPQMAFVHRENITSIYLPVSITSVGLSAFEDCKNLSSLHLPSSIISIEKRAFWNCCLLATINIPASLSSIGDRAFFYCNNLRTINIPASTATIGKSAFANCAAFITVDSENINYSSIDGVLFNKDKTDLLHYPISKAGAYTIPSTVKTINECAFLGCSLLTSVTIPNSVITIGDYAFEGCTVLSINSIPVTNIGIAAFKDCNNLFYIDIPNSVISIKNSAFSGCANLIAVTISNSITKIEDEMFLGCTDLGFIIIPNSVTLIGERAFSLCTSLSSVVLPNSITSIGNSAFDGCHNLSSITIPASVTSIGTGAFDYCSLASIYAFPTTPIELPRERPVFVGVNKNTCALYVPAESLELYKAAYVWKDFIKTNVITSSDNEIKNDAVRISPNPAKDVITIHADEGLVSIYNSNGKLVISHLLEQSKQVNISSLKPGMYVAAVNGENFKIIKE